MNTSTRNSGIDRYEVATRHPDTGKYVRYRIRWELPPDAAGDRRRTSKAGFATLDEAKAALADVTSDTAAGTYVPPTRQPLATYLQGWLGGLSVKPTTMDNYRTCALVHTIPRLGGIRLEDLTAEHVDGLYRQLETHGKRAGTCRTAGVTCRDHGCSPDRHDGLAPKSVRHVHTMLRKALADAQARGYVGRNVADLANPPTPKASRSRQARDKCWTVDQLRAFLGHAPDHRLGAVWALVSTTGMRRAEVCGLRWSDVDLNRGRLTVAQTITETRDGLVVQDSAKTDASERTIALDARTVAGLRQWRTRQVEERLAIGPAWTDTGLVFTREDGTGHRPKRLSSAFTAAARRAGVESVGIHGLRHSYATAALRAGVSPEVVSKRLGHASVVITLSIYAHVFETDDQAAADTVAAAIYGA